MVHWTKLNTNWSIFTINAISKATSKRISFYIGVHSDILGAPNFMPHVLGNEINLLPHDGHICVWQAGKRVRFPATWAWTEVWFGFKLSGYLRTTE